MLRKVAFLLSLMLIVIAPLLATPLFAQIDVPVEAAWYLQLLGAMLPVILPFANRYVFEAVQEIIGVIDKLPDLGKQMLIVLQSYGLTKFALWLGIALPADLSGFAPETTLAILTALAAMGMHKLAKDKQPQAA